MAKVAHLRKAHPRKNQIATELAYFRLNRARMRYAEIAAENLPIGSGIIEAACKTLSSRHKRSGMRWRTSGGQAIFTLRALIQSDRFDSAWAWTSTRSQPTQWIGACSARTSVVQATQTFISMATAIVKSRALNERLFTRAEPAGCGSTTR